MSEQLNTTQETKKSESKNWDPLIIFAVVGGLAITGTTGFGIYVRDQEDKSMEILDEAAPALIEQDGMRFVRTSDGWPELGAYDFDRIYDIEVVEGCVLYSVGAEFVKSNEKPTDITNYVYAVADGRAAIQFSDQEELIEQLGEFPCKTLVTEQ